MHPFLLAELPIWENGVENRPFMRYDSSPRHKTTKLVLGLQTVGSRAILINSWQSNFSKLPGIYPRRCLVEQYLLLTAISRSNEQRTATPLDI